MDPAIPVLQRAFVAHEQMFSRFVPLVEDMRPRLFLVEADVRTLKADVAEGNRKVDRIHELLLIIAAKVGLTAADLN